MMTFSFFFIALLAFFIHLAFDRKKRSLQRIAELLSLYLLGLLLTVTGLMGFIGHAFFADEIAKSIGWQRGSPFQFEVAIADLTLGVLGFLCFFFRDKFWLATSIASLVFFLGCGYGHIREIVIYHNFALNNAGPVLYFGDIFVPILTFVTVIIALTRKKELS